ncbi:hypothetical protein N9R81_04215 [Flavobacteriales bacterium]|nr:hypothetical protein [Flavobacteriales bacterium]
MEGGGCSTTNRTKNGGTSTGQISMNGHRGQEKSDHINYGGASGNGSFYGSGGYGYNWGGKPGEAGVVIVHW